MDHVLLGTGYKVNISPYSFLSRELVGAVNQIYRYPKLDASLNLLYPDYTSCVPHPHGVMVP